VRLKLQNAAVETNSQERNDSAHVLSRARPDISDSVHDIIRRFSAKQMVWTNKNFEEISRLCSALCLSDRDVNVLLKTLNGLDRSLSLPTSLYHLRMEEKSAIESTEYHIHECPTIPPVDDRGTCMIAGGGNCDLIMYDMFEICQNLLNHEGHAEHLHWNFEPQFSDTGSRCYNELWTSDWWREEERLLPCGTHGKILAVCISSDETHVTMAGRKLYPIYIYLGNYHRWFKNKGSGWALLGFQPVVTSRKGFSGRNAVRAYKRNVRRWVMDKLTESIKMYENGVLLDVRDTDGNVEGLLIYPRLAIYAGDEQEILRSVYGGMGGKCRKPCRLCHVSPRETGTEGHGLRDIAELRVKEDITQFFDPVTKTSSMSAQDSARLSVHPEFNALFFVPGFNPIVNPSCRMHQTDAGIFKNMMEDVVAVMREHGGPGCISRFDALWSELLPFTGSKAFRQGVTDTALLTAGECRCLSMCLPFVLRGVDAEFNVSEKAGLRTRSLEYVAMIYITWRWLLGEDNHDDSSLETLAILGDELQLQMETLRKAAKGDWDALIMEGPKFHNITHWNHWIRRYGSTGNYNTESFEKAHRLVIKKWVQKMALRGNCAEKKVLYQQMLYEAHAEQGQQEGDDETHEGEGICMNGRLKRWGRGGFRGRVNLTHWLGLDQVALNDLRKMEGAETFTSMSVEEMRVAYQQILGASVDSESKDIGLLIAILESARGFIRHAHTVAMKLPASKVGIPHMTAFSPNNPFNFVLWKKSRVQASQCYIQQGSVVKYRPNLFRIPDTSSDDRPFVGCVRWMFSIQKAQYMIVQRMNELAYPHGPKRHESIVDRLKRIVMIPDHANVDMLRCFCRMYKMSNPEELREHHSFDVLCLGEPDDTSLDQQQGLGKYPVAAGQCVQPCMRTLSDHAISPSHVFESVNARLLISEYTIV
jgi:hypothetical protein